MIHTYGGSEILCELFKSLSMLLNQGQSQSIFYPLCILGASFSVFWGISKAFFSPETFLNRFFLPFVLASFLLLLPSQKAEIVDHLSASRRQISKVPFLLLRVAELSSSLGFYLDQSLKSVLHLNESINKESVIFSNAPEFRNIRLSNANLERNMEHFCKNCVLYDVALRKYSLEELRKSKNLVALFKEKTGVSRSIFYCPLDGKGDCQFVSCKKAIQQMEAEFEGGVDGVFAWLNTNLGSFAQQKGQIHLIAYLRNYFAKEPPVKTTSSFDKISSKSLLSMKIVLEALLYTSFIFVLPLILLPGGFQCFFYWLKALLWLQLWPPLFTVLDYIMALIARAYLFETIFDLNIDQSKFIESFYQELHSSACVLGLSIPFMSYGLMQASISSLSVLSQGVLSLPKHLSSHIGGVHSDAAASSISASSDFARHFSFARDGIPNEQGRGFLEAELSSSKESLAKGFHGFDQTQSESLALLSGNSFMRQKGVSYERNESYSPAIQEALLEENTKKAEAQFIKDGKERISQINKALEDPDQMAFVADPDLYDRLSSKKAHLQTQMEQYQSDEKDWQISMTRLGVERGFSQETLLYQNGILSSYDDACHEAEAISKLYNREVSLLYNPSSNSSRAFESLSSSFLRGENATSRVTKGFLEQELSNGQKVFAIAHSEGAFNLSNAVKNLSTEHLDRLHLSTYGSPAFVHCDSAASVQNFSSKRDFVSSFSKMTSPEGSWTPLKDISFFSDYNLGGDHKILGKTYLSTMTKQGQEFQNRCLF